MAPKGVKAFPRDSVPEPDTFVPTAGYDSLAIGSNGDTENRFVVDIANKLSAGSGNRSYFCPKGVSKMNSSRSGLAEAHLIGSIQVLLNHDERLLEFFFHHKHRVPRLPSEELKIEAQALGLGEWIRIKAALDFWDGSGGATLNDLLRMLSEEDLLLVIRAILRRINILGGSNL